MSNIENDIFEKVKKIISKVLNLPEEKITENSKLVDELGAESLDFITLIMEFEDVFDKKISDIEAQKLVTVDDIVKFINQKINVGV
jgi:acyl carrier protein